MTRSKEVLSLYRQMLKHASHYPSVKRDGIIRDIKLEFRDNQKLTDSSIIEQKLQEAQYGLRELSTYSQLQTSQSNWNIEVGNNAKNATVNAKVVGEKK